MYSALLFLHVAFVLMLFLAFGVEWTSLIGLRGASTADEIRGPATTLAGLGRLYSPCGAGIALTGIYLATIEHLWTQAWVLVALAAIVLLALDGAVAGGRRVVDLARRLQQTTGQLPEDLQRQVSGPELMIFVYLRAGATMGLLFLMIFKPGWTGSLAAMAVGIAVGWIAGRRVSVATPTNDAAVDPRDSHWQNDKG